jgi:hypothetical protein
MRTWRERDGDEEDGDVGKFPLFLENIFKIK